MDAAIAAESSIVNFLGTIRALVQDASDERQFGPAESELLSHLQSAQSSGHEALCDSFDTPRVMNALLDLISKANIYRQNNACPCHFDLRRSFHLPDVRCLWDPNSGHSVLYQESRPHLMPSIVGPFWVRSPRMSLSSGTEFAVLQSRNRRISNRSSWRHPTSSASPSPPMES